MNIYFLALFNAIWFGVTIGLLIFMKEKLNRIEKKINFIMRNHKD